MNLLDPAFIDADLDCRAATFENPTGARGAGGTAHGGRKGAPNRRLAPGERVVLADLEGPGTIRHIWMTIPPAPPEVMRALRLEAFYDGRPDPSISVPCLDYFGLPHGRPVAYHSALASAQEGRGFNSYVPIPFTESVRLELTNESPHPTTLYYQVDYTLEAASVKGPNGKGAGADAPSYLHVTFRRENPTVQRRDFVIADGIEGPGRFLGTVVGVRIIDPGDWYGEGEVKVYRDGDEQYPTICGTGLEDYVGSAWGLGAHAADYAGAPLVREDLVGFYRWHLADPIMFARELRVTIQQIGAAFFAKGQDAELAAYELTNPIAGEGWHRPSRGPLLAWGICERVDDYCATSFVYARRPQPVPRLDMAAALTDMARRPGEEPHPMEQALGSAVGDGPGEADTAVDQ
jgi:hypothetical protein